MRECATSALCGLVAALLIAGCTANFVDGDFVPMSRRAQFHGQRTQWHDVLGPHCPRFGSSATVALPLPQPVGFQEVDDYKIQLSLEGDRFVTPWLQVVGRRAPAAPSLHVQLVRSGDALVAVAASVRPLPDEYAAHHAQVASEFGNVTQWPKHLVVRYSWEARHAVDATRGLTVLFAACGAAALALAGSTVGAYRRQLRQFLDDVAGDGGGRAAKAD